MVNNDQQNSLYFDEKTTNNEKRCVHICFQGRVLFFLSRWLLAVGEEGEGKGLVH